MNRPGNYASLNVLYLNGMTAKAKVDLEIRENRYQEFTVVLKELIGYEGSLELCGKEEQLAQKFASFFPEQTSEQDRVAAFISQDADSYTHLDVYKRQSHICSTKNCFRAFSLYLSIKIF